MINGLAVPAPAQLFLQMQNGIKRNLEGPNQGEPGLHAQMRAMFLEDSLPGIVDGLLAIDNSAVEVENQCFHFLDCTGRFSIR